MKMDDKNKLPKRKHPRLNSFDYSSTGAYFITICTKNRKSILSQIVGRGLAPAETVEIEYTALGKIVEKQLLSLEQRYPCLEINQYVIMPNHIHAILILRNAAGASPRPTVMDAVCAFKSLTTIEVKRNGYKDGLFQTSFFEHVIRDRIDYDKLVKYIYENPVRWHFDELYEE